MAKMYYTQEEAMARLGATEQQLRDFIRDGKLREFRDAGKLNYRVEEVDRLLNQASHASSSGELSLDDSTQLTLSPLDSDHGKTKALSSSGSLPGLSGSLPGLSGSSPGLSGSSPGLSGGTEAPIDLGASDSGVLSLGGSSGSGLRLDDSKAGSSGELRLDDSKGGSKADILSLDEVDKDAVKPMKKDDTVITNIGISVFDDEDLEIAADPMAKTLMTGGDEHLGLDGSGGGSGLLDLTRESDDTSLGAELLEGIDMGDTAATVAQSVEVTQAAPGEGDAGPMLEPGPGLDVPGSLVMVPAGGYAVEAASPAFTGLLVAAALVLALAGGMAIATSQNTWPSYLDMLGKDYFWFFLGGAIVLGAICAGIGYAVGMPKTPRAPKAAKPVKEKAVKEKKVKAKK